MGKRLAAAIAAAFLLAGLICGPAGAQSTFRLIDDQDQFHDRGFPSDPAGAIQRAREKIAAGDLQGAIKELSIYVAAHPREVAPARFLGDLYYRDGEFSHAEDVYQTLLLQNPRDKETHNRLGVVYATENRVDDAIEQFNLALPGTDSVGDLVALHQRKGDLPQYLTEMQRLSVDQPSDAVIQAEVGQVYTALHQPTEAMMYYMRALDSDKQSLTGLNGLGLSYLDLHNPSEAIKNFQACLRIDPTNYTCQNNLGAAYLQSGQDANANASLKIAYHEAPERPEALVNFGYLADLHGDWKKAVDYYVRATAVGPYLPEAYVDLGIDYEHNNLYALAESALLKGAAAAPHDGRIHYLLAVAYVSEGKTTLALSQLDLAKHSLDPDVARIAEQESARLSAAPMTSPQ
ncbi:MAG TPA: tetratricopeptide repeat protein [Candidatus Acidoferrales bacterium]|nr:tetratricopeptide repeat protein [Candidatus Acidoferrales bacterium]